MLRDLLDRVRSYLPTSDLSILEKAYRFADEAHAGQMRQDDVTPYFEHPLAVVNILAEMEMDLPTLCAGLLHDTVEDVETVTLKTVRQEFGEEVAELVDGVTKLDRLEFMSREEQQAESLRKMLVAMARDIRVVIIKLADRKHNMSTLENCPLEKQRRIARETQEIYAPLAHRLGIFTLKTELEDLSFRILEPEAYRELAALVASRLSDREAWLTGIMAILREKVDELGIRADIYGRPKHLYSIYRKMTEQGKTFDQIYDLIAVRALVDSVPECYAVLGTVHTVWKPMMGRFKDYIAVPKPNLYQSLHTTMLGPQGTPFEVQIRTHEMHRIAEFGVAAHWKYKEGRQQEGELDKKLQWLRQIMDLQSTMDDAREFMQSLKMDLFSDEVFVFTPKGDVIDLPAGATTIDFAYRVHSAVGNRCVGAKVSGRIVPLETQLQTGDIVEILTSSNSKGPSRDWLNIAVTSQARAKIKSWFKRELKDENIARGRDMLERESKRLGFALTSLIKQEALENLFRRYSFSDMNDVYASIGFGSISTGQVLAKLTEENKARQQAAIAKKAEEAQRAALNKQLPVPSSTSHGVYVKGEPGMLVRFARCCSPVPGDPIVGYITRGRGVSVHRADCMNLLDGSMEEERLIDVNWDSGQASSYTADIQVVAYERAGIIANLTALLDEMGVDLVSIAVRPPRNNTMLVNIAVQIKNTQQLEHLIKQLHKNSDIIEVHRGAG